MPRCRPPPGMSRLTLLFLLLAGLAAGQAPPLTAGDSNWDDFANNLATDLAPFLVLFGEQVTQQFINESTQPYDYALFAIAPIGVITTLVAVIRVCGSASLRAFIGRGKESPTQAEVELCSSTGGDVCELYNGGVTRLFGRPKLLEVVYRGDGEIATIDRLRSVGAISADAADSPPEYEAVQRAAPNLGLNAGFQPCSPLRSWLLICFGCALQAGVLVLAGLATLHFEWKKGDEDVPHWALYLMVAGTLVMSLGVYLAAHLIGESTAEVTYRPDHSQTDARPPNIYWLQPGNQMLADQVFGSFAYSKPFEYYIRSWKRPGKRPLAVWVTCAITLVGFGLQFFGLRSLHASVTMAQILLSLLMSIVRSSLRTTRLRGRQNLVHRQRGIVEGHELDWLAMRMVYDAVAQDSTPPPSSRLVPPNIADSTFDKGVFPLTSRPTILTALQADADRNNIEFVSGHQMTANIIKARYNLAEITKSHGSDTDDFGDPAPYMLEPRMVAARRQSQQLCRVLERILTEMQLCRRQEHLELGNFAEDADFSNGRGFVWELKCALTSDLSHVATAQDAELATVRVAFFPHSDEWKIENPEHIEAVLALCLWQLTKERHAESFHRSGGDSSPATPRRAMILGTDWDRVIEYMAWFPRSPHAPPRIVRSTRLRPGSRLWTDIRPPQNIHAMSTPRLPLVDNQSDLGDQRADEAHDYSDTVFFGWNQQMFRDQADPSSPEPDSQADAADCEVYFEMTDVSVTSALVHELFGSFMASLMVHFQEISDLTVRRTPNTGQLCITNTVVERLAAVFTEGGLGSNEDALRCLLPATRPAPYRVLPSAYEFAQKATRDTNTGDGEVDDTVLWAWEIAVQTTADFARIYDPTVTWARPLYYSGSIVHRYMAVWACEFFRWVEVRVPNSVYRASTGLSKLRSILDDYTDVSAEKHTDVGSTIDAYLGADSNAVDSASGPTQAELLESEEYADFLALATNTMVWSSSVTPTEVYGLAQIAAAKDVPELIFPILSLMGVPVGEVDQTDEMGRTVLWYAAAAGAETTIMMLLLVGADAGIADNDHVTPCAMAASKGVCLEVIANMAQATTSEHILNQEAAGDKNAWLVMDHASDEVISFIMYEARYVLDAIPAAFEAGRKDLGLRLLHIFSEFGIQWGNQISLFTHRPETLRAMFDIEPFALFKPSGDEYQSTLLSAAGRRHWKSVELLLHHGATLDKDSYRISDITELVRYISQKRDILYNRWMRRWRRDGWPRRERRVLDNGDWVFVEVTGRPDWFPELGEKDVMWEIDGPLERSEQGMLDNDAMWQSNNDAMWRSNNDAYA